jgi:hypothetical protein
MDHSDDVGLQMSQQEFIVGNATMHGVIKNKISPNESQWEASPGPSILHPSSLGYTGSVDCSIGLIGHTP